MMEKQTVTIYDVAREANVSMATVSRVVNGNPNVKPATRKKVLEVIERLDYRPNAVARGLASKRTTTVGVIIPDVSNIFFASLARGIDDVATMYKYNIILANSDENQMKELKVLNTLLSKQVDGLIYMGYVLSDAIRQELKRTRTPVVLAGTVDPEGMFPSVNIDYGEATYHAVKRLLETGSKQIAFVSGPLSDPINGVYRLLGYQRALKEYHIPYDETLIYAVDPTYHAGEALSKSLLDQCVDGIYVSDDLIAVGVLNGLTDRGVLVPERVQIITSNHTLLTQISRPQLTSIKQPLYDIGAVSMRLLTKLMHQEEIEEQTVILPYSMTEKESTRPLNHD